MRLQELTRRESHIKSQREEIQRNVDLALLIALRPEAEAVTLEGQAISQELVTWSRQTLELLVKLVDFNTRTQPGIHSQIETLRSRVGADGFPRPRKVELYNLKVGRVSIRDVSRLVADIAEHGHQGILRPKSLLADSKR